MVKTVQRRSSAVNSQRHASEISKLRIAQRTLASLLALVSLCAAYPQRLDAQDAQGQQSPAQVPPGDPFIPQTPEQLEQLVAPIALYPDSLVAQILAASTFPEQIVEAAYHPPVAATPYYGAYYPPVVVNSYSSGCYNCGGWAVAGAVVTGAVVGAAVANANNSAAVANANAAAANANAAAANANAAAAAANQNYTMGEIVGAIPAGCAVPVVNGTAYYLRGDTWFSASYGANGVYYRVVPTP